MTDSLAGHLLVAGPRHAARWARVARRAGLGPSRVTVRGEVEVRLALVDAAPATVEADGDDLEVVILYNPINNSYA